MIDKIRELQPRRMMGDYREYVPKWSWSNKKLWWMIDGCWASHTHMLDILAGHMYDTHNPKVEL